MSVAAPLAGPAVPRGPAGPDAARRGRVLGALALLRATGPVGIASAVIIAIAILMAVFGTFVAPYDRTCRTCHWPGALPPVATCSATTSRDATSCPGCWSARGPRCSGRWP